MRQVYFNGKLVTQKVRQFSMHRIIRKMSVVVASHIADVLQFLTDPEVMEAVSEGFYAFKGSELLKYNN